MTMFNMTIKAIATRMVGDQTGAEEHITSEFTVQGDDAVSASEGAICNFKAKYTLGLDGSQRDCANLDDFEITSIQVVPQEDKP